MGTGESKKEEGRIKKEKIKPQMTRIARMGKAMGSSKLRG
jgi:hypothetical protein